MVRGTTAEFKFNIPCKFNELYAAKIIFWQPDNNGTIDHPLPIVKNKNSCSCHDNPNGHELYVTLTQEETFRFMDDRKAYVQLKASSTDSLVFASKEEKFTVYPAYDNSIIDADPLPTPVDDLLILDGGEIGVIE